MSMPMKIAANVVNGIPVDDVQALIQSVSADPTEGDIDLRGFLGLDASISPGYDALKSTLTVKGSASPEDFRKVFDMAVATSPNVHNITRPVALACALEVVTDR